MGVKQIMPVYTIIEFANIIKHVEPKIYDLILNDIKKGVPLDTIAETLQKL